MPLLPLADALAIAAFALAWTLYAVFLRLSDAGDRSLNALMDKRRRAWMREMADREVRMVDAQINASLQNGAAFFTSTSLIAIGGGLALLRATDDVFKVLSDLPFGAEQTRNLWEVKCIGLIVIFGFAFFKFGWSYRLYNYASILIGATPHAQSEDDAAREAAATAAADMAIAGGAQFALGQRAFFVALAYLGWFLGPLALVVTTALTVSAMARRQFASLARRAVA